MKRPAYLKLKAPDMIRYFTAILILLISLNGFSQKFEQLALTPPMGWNSWNKFACDGINEEVIRKTADAMVSSGMKDAGYEYVVIDDCWQVDRDSSGFIVADPKKFPSGIKALADYVHSKGLKFGIYSCAGRRTCAGRPASRGHRVPGCDILCALGRGLPEARLVQCGRSECERILYTHAGRTVQGGKAHRIQSLRVGNQ